MQDDLFSQWVMNHLPTGFLADEYKRFINCDELEDHHKFENAEPISNQEIAQLYADLTKYGIKNLTN